LLPKTPKTPSLKAKIFINQRSELYDISTPMPITLPNTSRVSKTYALQFHQVS